MYNIEIKIVRKLRYCTVKKYHHTYWPYWGYFYCNVNSLPTILVSQNNPSCICRRQYNKIIFASYFLRPISLENMRNLLIRFQRFIFYSATILTFCNLPGKIVLRNNVGTWESIDTDHRPQTRDEGRHTLNLSYYLTALLFLLNITKTSSLSNPPMMCWKW